MSFIITLKENGWEEVQESVSYSKNNWVLNFDTSSWIEVGTKNNSHIFDVPFPEQAKEIWTLNLIEHLCKTDDELFKLNKKNEQNT